MDSCNPEPPASRHPVWHAARHNTFLSPCQQTTMIACLPPLLPLRLVQLITALASIAVHTATLFENQLIQSTRSFYNNDMSSNVPPVPSTSMAFILVYIVVTLVTVVLVFLVLYSHHMNKWFSIHVDLICTLFLLVLSFLAMVISIQSNGGFPSCSYSVDLGCWADSESNKEMNFFVKPDFADGGNPLESCMGRCLRSGFPYAGYQYDTRCFCGYSYGHHGRAFFNSTANVTGPDLCYLECNGQPNSTCNDLIAMAIFYSSESMAYDLGTYCFLGNADSSVLIVGVTLWILAVVLLLWEGKVKGWEKTDKKKCQPIESIGLDATRLWGAQNGESDQEAIRRPSFSALQNVSPQALHPESTTPLGYEYSPYATTPVYPDVPYTIANLATHHHRHHPEPVTAHAASHPLDPNDLLSSPPASTGLQKLLGYDPIHDGSPPPYQQHDQDHRQLELRQASTSLAAPAPFPVPTAPSAFEVGTGERSVAEPVSLIEMSPFELVEVPTAPEWIEGSVTNVPREARGESERDEIQTKIEPK
ncbi:hypothetical protein BC937DRAFT_86794 [Endogone sp. FLAS-F59071]|nr:hypothetical protein BC937DRAFT_86794 [Endogone sp. FLAS-F59071]|eukprot:RUS22794.1 hypothetical protein BC937DRAFT_86794 [Endogone sp. FLAS-F59071]